MLITDKKCPVLPMLRSGDPGDLYTFETPSEADSQKIAKLWSDLNFVFKARVRLVTKPFMDAYERAFDRLNKKGLLESVETQGGTILYGNMTMCYAVMNDDDALSVQTFIFYKQMLVIVTDARTDKATSQVKYYVWTSPTYDKHVGRENELDHVKISASQSDSIALLNFFKYVQTETKLVGPKQRVKDIDCKYVNQTNTGVEIVDSRWFTDIVRSDGFKVRGHFRLQPCGTGLADRKLIWIADFQKEGYTSKAKKELTI